MSTAYSFTGCYRFDSTSAIDAALGELHEVLETGQAEDKMPDPFGSGEIAIDGIEVRFAINGGLSDWFDYYNTIVETFAEHASSGEVTVDCDGHIANYTAGPVT